MYAQEKSVFDSELIKKQFIETNSILLINLYLYYLIITVKVDFVLDIYYYLYVFELIFLKKKLKFIIFSSRFADMFNKHLRIFLLFMYIGSLVAFAWFTLLVNDILPKSRGKHIRIHRDVRQIQEASFLYCTWQNLVINLTS